MLDLLRYSTEDQRRSRPNPTRVPINGDLRNNLASYRAAVNLYRKFLSGESIDKRTTAPATGLSRPSLDDSRSQADSGRCLPPPPVSPEHARTLVEFGLDGQAALSALIASSRYRTLAQAMASLALFSHPDTVAQTGGKAVFPCIRGAPGAFSRIADGREVMLDDNKSPTDAFLWCNGLNRRGRDTQFNHIWAASNDADAYTALPNLCMTPAFLAKLTDTNAETKALLAYRSWDLYGWTPAGFEAPGRPDGYAALEWAAPLPPVRELRQRLAIVFARRAKDRTVLAASRLCWLFG